MSESLAIPKGVADVRLTRERISDWCGFLIFVTFGLRTLQTPENIGLTILPAILIEAIIACSFLIRTRPVAADRAVGPRLAAYVGTFLPVIFLPAAATWAPHWLHGAPPEWMKHIAAACWLAGALTFVPALWGLRRSFSIEPAARTLVTGGMYRLARHPVYVGYLLVYAALICLNPTLPIAMMLAAWLCATLCRVRYEERVLSRAFPEEYAAYRKRVAMFGPRLGGLFGAEQA